VTFYFSSQSDFDEIKGCAGSRLIILFFTAKWCGPCQQIKEPYHTMAEKEEYNAVFCEVDVDEAADLLSSFGINCMPTFVFFKDGIQLEKLEGGSQGNLRKRIEKYE
uniref:Thioredoxin domain-containing protein n=1 Tax=Petromyzon marinus TaxID=7757 RepID=S4RRA8_PETMA